MHDPFAELAAWRRATGSPCETLCRAPFSQLHFTPDGDVAVCSKSAQRKLGNVRTDRLRDLWRGPAMAAIREELRQGSFPAGCHYCDGHLRRHNVRNNPVLDFDRVPVHDDGEWPARLEFAFSDLCNLSCRQCSPDLSSTLRIRAGLPRRPAVYGDAFFAELEAFLPHVRSVSLLGGEPLLHAEVFRLLDLLRRGSGAIPGVHVTTNGTVWNDRIAELVAALPVQLAVSIDGATARTFERIRVGARFDRVLANVESMAAAQRHQAGRLRFNFCLMRSNWHEFADVLLLAQRFSARVWVTLVTVPARQGLLSLSPAARQRVVDGLEARTEELRDIAAPNLVAWHEVLRTLRFAPARTVPPTFAMEVAARRHRHEELLMLKLKAAALRHDTDEIARHVAASPALPSLRVARWLKERGHMDLAAAAAAMVPAEAPDHPAAVLLRAEVRLAAGDLEAAESLLTTASARTQPLPHTWLLRSWLRFRQGRIDEGLDEASRLAAAIAEMPESATWLVAGLLAVRGNLYRAARRWRDALADLEELVRIEPANPQHPEFLGIVRAEALAAGA